MEIRHEVIRIKGSDPHFLRVRSTRNGPIVTDHGGAVPYASYDVRPVEIFPTDLILTELSLRWTALEPGSTHYAVLLYNRARDFDEFRQALSYFDTPGHNFLYADVHGNIGYVHPGRLPLRGRGTGSLPAPARTAEKRAELQEEIEDRVAGALAARQMISEWDLMMETDSVGATVFAQFYVELCRKTFADQLPPHVWSGPWNTTYGYRMQNSLWLLVGDLENEWWDDVRTPDLRETRDHIVARALAAAYEQLTEQLGKRTDRWAWGRAHTATFRNATLGRSGIRFVERIFNRGPVTVPGGLDALRRSDFRVNEPFAVHHIASLRMVVDTADWSSALYVHGLGQSGHPASRHYADMLRPWAEGTYRAHPWTHEEIRDQSRRRLVLEPIR